MLDISSVGEKKDSSTNDDRAKCEILLVAQADFAVDGMVSLLENYPDRFVVSVTNPQDLTMEKVKSLAPDVILLHTKAVKKPVEEFIHDIKEISPASSVLLFGYNMDDAFLYSALRAGASGYLNENMRGDHLTTALNTVFSGGYWAERHIINRFVSDRSIHDKINDKIDSLRSNLTRRETEVLVLILEGLPTNDIAERICLSHQGVKAHLTNLFRKFGVKNRSQLILATLNQVSPISNMSTVIQRALQGEDITIKNAS